MTSIVQQNCQIIDQLKLENDKGRRLVVLIMSRKWRNISLLSRGRNRRNIESIKSIMTQFGLAPKFLKTQFH